jgi:hypothetical protein
MTKPIPSLLRFSLMYTTINLVFVITWVLWPVFIQELIRANSLLILFTVSYFWIIKTNWQMYIDFHKSLSSVSDTAILGLYAICELCIHLVPVLIIGLPILTPLLSTAIVSVCVTVWYLAVRRNNLIQKIYLDSITIETYDNVFCWGVVCTLLVAVIIEL